MAYRGCEQPPATEGHVVLYLLEPSLTVLCNHDPGSAETLERAGTDPLVDLGELRWVLIEKPVDPLLLLKLALIRGTPCSRGMVVDAALFGIVERGQPNGGENRRSEPSASRSTAHQQAVDNWLGTPPNVVQQRQVAAERAAAQQAEDQRRAEARAHRLLDAPPSEALLRHWITLGGPETG
jgi:hypothetical protein